MAATSTMLGMDDGASTCCTATRSTQQTDEAPAGGSATIGSATSAVATIGSATSAVAKSNHGQRPPLQPDHRGMVELPGGPFLMGSTDTTFPADAEGP
ncbi:MAG TPA: hypothetical protein VFN03_00115, partial [Trueperaceae bacterium]|nr:hypothetical protein [Trueperaceae bacterium]